MTIPMILVIQAILDAILFFLVFRLWQERQAISRCRADGDPTGPAQPWEEYRAELMDLLDTVETTIRTERESLMAAVQAARELMGPDNPATKGETGADPGSRVPVASVRDSVRTLAEQNLPVPRIASSLGLGVREVDLLLNVSGTGVATLPKTEQATPPTGERPDPAHSA